MYDVILIFPHFRCYRNVFILRAMRFVRLTRCFLSLDRNKRHYRHYELFPSRACKPLHSAAAQINTHGPLGSNQTLPRRIVFGSCSSQNEDLSYWDRILDVAPDLIILMGDNVYGRDEGLEEAYAAMGRHPGFQRARQTIPILATLDDNDYHCHSLDKNAAKELFLEFFQIPMTDCRWETDRGVYSSYIWGDNLELHIILLDVRFSKSAFLPSDGKSNHRGPYSPDTNESLTMLGPKQWQWLQHQLNIPAQLRIICSPIQVLAEGHCWDCWSLFPRERERLLSMIQRCSSDSTNKTILLSGDRHVGGFYHKDDLWEVTSSSLTHSVPSGLLNHETDSTRAGPFVHCNNFGCLDVTYGIIKENQPPSLQISLLRADTGLLIGETWTRRI